MEMKKLIEKVQKELESLSVSPNNLVLAIVKLLELAHKHGLDDEARSALEECGIALDIEEA